MSGPPACAAAAPVLLPPRSAATCGAQPGGSRQAVIENSHCRKSTCSSTGTACKRAQQPRCQLPPLDCSCCCCCCCTSWAAGAGKVPAPCCVGNCGGARGAASRCAVTLGARLRLPGEASSAAAAKGVEERPGVKAKGVVACAAAASAAALARAYPRQVLGKVRRLRLTPAVVRRVEEGRSVATLAQSRRGMCRSSCRHDSCPASAGAAAAAAAAAVPSSPASLAASASITLEAGSLPAAASAGAPAAAAAVPVGTFPCGSRVRLRTRRQAPSAPCR